jgi:hypothetical protein
MIKFIHVLNATCKINIELVLIFLLNPSTACRTSTTLPALDHAVPSYQQWVTPEMGLKSTQSKGNPSLG